MKRPLYDANAFVHTRKVLCGRAVAGRPGVQAPLDVASFRHASGAAGGGLSDDELVSDFADFMAGDHALLSGELPPPDPVFKERLRSSLWRTYVMVRGFDGKGRH